MGACIIGAIGVLARSTLLIAASVVLLILSCIRYKPSPPTNYSEKFGPADPEEDTGEGFGTMMAEQGVRDDGENDEDSSAKKNNE